MARPAVTILSTADFDNPVWTNKQYIAVGLSERFDVYYINSLGLRRPSFNATDMKRLFRRLLSRPIVESPAGKSRAGEVTVLSPRVLPLHNFAIVRKLNSLILNRHIARIPSDRRQVLWTFSPLTYGLEKSFDHTVYHSVDLLHTFPGVPGKFVLDCESSMVTLADATIASSSGVAEHLSSLGAQATQLWENVADTELYEHSAKENRKHRVIFSGNLTSTKIDFELLIALARRGIPVALAGPIGFDGTASDEKLHELLNMENVRYLGLLQPEDLAVEVGASKVGLIPYNVNEHTAGIFPMKVYEYLSAGLAVVATPLASLRDSRIVGLSVADRERFVQTVMNEIDSFDAEGAKERTAFARPYSWTARFEEARQLVDSLSQRTK